MSDALRNGSFTRSFDGNRMPTGRDPVQPRFHIEAIQDEAASAREGRPIFRHEERVQHLMPGSPNSPVERVRQEHIDRWPEQYAAFKRGSEMSIEGTPIEQWNILNRGMVMELKAIGFQTIEQIADASDLALQRIPRLGHKLRERAKAYLDDAEASKLTEQLAAADERNKSLIASQQRQIDELTAMVNRLHAQVTAKADEPSPIQSFVPGMNNPIEAMRVQNEQAVIDATSTPSATSALEAMLAEPRRRGRPPKNPVSAFAEDET